MYGRKLEGVGGAIICLENSNILKIGAYLDKTCIFWGSQTKIVNNREPLQSNYQYSIIYIRIAQN